MVWDPVVDVHLKAAAATWESVMQSGGLGTTTTCSMLAPNGHVLDVLGVWLFILPCELSKEGHDLVYGARGLFHLGPFWSPCTLASWRPSWPLGTANPLTWRMGSCKHSWIAAVFTPSSWVPLDCVPTIDGGWHVNHESHLHALFHTEREKGEGPIGYVGVSSSNGMHSPHTGKS